jgi:hypothetical protein
VDVAATPIDLCGRWVTHHARYRRQKETNTMFMTPENALYLAKQHGKPNLAARLIVQAWETLARITQGEQFPAPEAGKPVEMVTNLHPVV